MNRDIQMDSNLRMVKSTNFSIHDGLIVKRIKSSGYFWKCEVPVDTYVNNVWHKKGNIYFFYPYELVPYNEVKQDYSDGF